MKKHCFLALLLSGVVCVSFAPLGYLTASAVSEGLDQIESIEETLVPYVYSDSHDFTFVFAQEVSSQDEAQPFTATLDDDFIANKLALMFKYDFTKQDIETTIAPKLIETIGGGKLKEFEYLDTVNIDDENSRQMYIALLDLEDFDKQSAYEIAVDLFETGYFYSVEMNMVGIPSITETTTATTTTSEQTTTTTTTTTTEAEKITDIEQIRSMLIAFVEENGLDAKLVSDDNYPEYYGTVVIEFNSDSDANRSILFFAKQNNIDIDCLNFVPCVNGIPITGGEISIITDIQQIRDMLTVFINDNNLDAKVVSDEKYPQYSGTVVIEFSSDTNADREVLEYAVKNSIERTQINLIPCIDGNPITTANPDTENTTTTTTTTTTDGTNTDLPQTGNNSMTNILITITALLLTATGAGAVYSSGILRRKEDDK